MELQLKIVGVLSVILAIMHGFFPRYFGWNKALSSLSTLNRQIMEVHTFFIGLIVLLIGLLCLSSTGELISTPLGRKICLGLGLFWLTRLYFQWFVYRSTLWKGKVFETSVHILFTLLWIYFSAVFLLVVYNG